DTLRDQPEDAVVGSGRVAVHRFARPDEQRHLMLPHIEAAEGAGPRALPRRHDRWRGHRVDRVREADFLRVLVVVSEEPCGVAAHLHHQIRNVLENRNEIVYQDGGSDHCLPPRLRSSTMRGAISSSIFCAVSWTTTRFLGENTAQGSILLVIHALTRSLRV